MEVGEKQLVLLGHTFDPLVRWLCGKNHLRNMSGIQNQLNNDSLFSTPLPWHSKNLEEII